MPGQSFGAPEVLLTEFIGHTTTLVHQGGWSYGLAGKYQSLALKTFYFPITLHGLPGKASRLIFSATTEGRPSVQPCCHSFPGAERS